MYKYINQNEYIRFRLYTKKENTPISLPYIQGVDV